MRVRALAYSLFLCGLLAYLSFRIHMAPSQVELRLERDLGEYLTVEPRVDGGEQPSLGLISARGILIPASPPLAERSILGLEEIRINDPRSTRAFRRVLASESAGATASSFLLHAKKANLWLDHDADVTPDGAHRWNFDDLLGRGAVDRLGERRAQALLDRIDVRIQELRSGRPRAAYTLELGDAEVRIAAGGVALDADLLAGASWSGGRIVAEWLTGGSLRVRGRIEDFDSLEPWLPLFPETHRRMLEVLQPTGAVAVDVDDLVLGRGGVTAFRATVRHYATTFRLGGLGAGISRLQGEMRLGTDGLSIGRDGPRASGDLLGIPVEVGAQVSASRARVDLAATRLALELLPIEGASTPGAARRPLQALWARLGPRGFLSGTAEIGLAPGEREELEADLRIEDLSLGGAPAVAGARVSCRLQTDPAGRTGGLKGKVVADLPVDGLGRLRGEAHLVQEGGQARITLYDMRWEPPAAKPGRAGSLFGTLAWSMESGLGDVDLRWTDGGLDTKLIAGEGISGQWKKAGAGSSGTVEIGPARIPGALLGQDADGMEFEKGDGVLGLDGTRLRVASLRLWGERRALRAAGTVSATGAMDLVVLIGSGPTRDALQALPHGSAPPDWIETARGSFRAFRLTGTPAAPVAREIGELDPAFVRR